MNIQAKNIEIGQKFKLDDKEFVRCQHNGLSSSSGLPCIIASCTTETMVIGIMEDNHVEAKVKVSPRLFDLFVYYRNMDPMEPGPHPASTLGDVFRYFERTTPKYLYSSAGYKNVIGGGIEWEQLTKVVRQHIGVQLDQIGNELLALHKTWGDKTLVTEFRR